MFLGFSICCHIGSRHAGEQCCSSVEEIFRLWHYHGFACVRSGAKESTFVLRWLVRVFFVDALYLREVLERISAAQSGYLRRRRGSHVPNSLYPRRKADHARQFSTNRNMYSALLCGRGHMSFPWNRLTACIPSHVPHDILFRFRVQEAVFDIKFTPTEEYYSPSACRNIFSQRDHSLSFASFWVWVLCRGLFDIFSLSRHLLAVMYITGRIWHCLDPITVPSCFPPTHPPVPRALLPFALPRPCLSGYISSRS